MKRINLLLAAAFALALLIPNGQSSAQQMLKIKGSDTVLPLAQAWSESYMKRNPKAMIAVTGGGTGVGIASLVSGSCDIANASREAKPKEIQSAKDRNVRLVRTAVAKDGISIIVHPSNPIKSLTIQQLKGIYLGAQSWKEFGGSTRTIVATGRDSSSGTYAFFQDTVLGGRRYRADMLTLPSNNAICQTVAQDEGAIGYVGIAYARNFGSKVKVVPVSDGKGSAIMPSEESVAKGTYPLFRVLYNYTKGKPTGLAKAYLDFALSPEGQSIVEKVGYVRLK